MQVTHFEHSAPASAQAELVALEEDELVELDELVEVDVDELDGWPPEPVVDVAVVVAAPPGPSFTSWTPRICAQAGASRRTARKSLVRARAAIRTLR